MILSSRSYHPSPDTPHLSIKIQAAIELSLTLPYPIRFAIRRVAKGDPTDNRPLIVRWNPALDAFSPPNDLVLLRHSFKSGGGNLEPIPVDHSGCDFTRNEDAVVVSGNGNSQFLWELSALGSEVGLTATLPERYYRAIIQAGGSFGPCGVYALLFPGAELGVWDWGTLSEHTHSGREIRDGGAGTKLIVPGGARIHFDAVEFNDRQRDAYEAEHGFGRANLAQRERHERAEQRFMANRLRLRLTPPLQRV
jgi:hypothetical protein